MGNKITDILNIKYPIIQGGMGNISDPELAAAISNAGGLGTIGVGTLSALEAEKKIKIMMKHTTKACCVNIPISVNPETKQIVEAIIRQKVPVVSLSAGNPSIIIPQLKKNNRKVICVSATVKQAKKAEEAGADIIVCEGYEAAGINALNESTTMTLIPQISKNVSIPVVAAGGIADGKGMAAAFSLGASGIQMGTRFVATKEASFHKAYKQAIIDSTDESTVIVGREFNKIRRIIKGTYSEKLLDLENREGSITEFIEKTDEVYHKIGAVDGDLVNGFINGGQIAGFIDDCPSVAHLMERMMKEAKDALNGSKEMLKEEARHG
ncbi:NAD(P)H-dependent flavin oxidoreductase [Oceanobacillus sp. J11TS1]|uniref:NAD(P)H-dependent flavin oxidoreductase n=1 Tax=Oceanobacillus sp. J11TS1 TaxID=2807191 RepID=UPI001B081D14|nr:2-nitropropane dioxygenase [Oceanobacillus sp. J11TS1]